jgi:hypothetical protein
VRLLLLDTKAAPRNGGGLLGSLCVRPYRDISPKVMGSRVSDEPLVRTLI